MHPELKCGVHVENAVLRIASEVFPSSPFSLPFSSLPLFFSVHTLPFTPLLTQVAVLMRHGRLAPEDFDGVIRTSRRAK